MSDAIITKNGDNYEVRCGICGKLLCIVSENSKNDVDLSSLNVIIVARCTRSSCKTDNRITLADIFNIN